MIRSRRSMHWRHTPKARRRSISRRHRRSRVRSRRLSRRSRRRQRPLWHTAVRGRGMRPPARRFRALRIEPARAIRWGRAGGAGGYRGNRHRGGDGHRAEHVGRAGDTWCGVPGRCGSWFRVHLRALLCTVLRPDAMGDVRAVLPAMPAGKWDDGRTCYCDLDEGSVWRVSAHAIAARRAAAAWRGLGARVTAEVTAMARRPVARTCDTFSSVIPAIATAGRSICSATCFA